MKVFSRGQLVKTHPRVKPGGRSTDPKDYPVGRAEYALRDVATLTAKAAAAGPAVGVYADPAAGGPAALDADADGLPAARPGPQLRRRAGRAGVRAGAGARRRRRHQDRPDARAGPSKARRPPAARRRWSAGRPASPATPASSRPARRPPGRGPDEPATHQRNQVSMRS